MNRTKALNGGERDSIFSSFTDYMTLSFALKWTEGERYVFSSAPLGPPRSIAVLITQRERVLTLRMHIKRSTITVKCDYNVKQGSQFPFYGLRLQTAHAYKENSLSAQAHFPKGDRKRRTAICALKSSNQHLIYCNYRCGSVLVRVNGDTYLEEWTSDSRGPTHSPIDCNRNVLRQASYMSRYYIHVAYTLHTYFPWSSTWRLF